MDKQRTQRRSNRDIALRLLEIVNLREFDKLNEVFHEDAVTEWPQSGERVIGLDDARHIFESYPNEGPEVKTGELEFVQGDEDRYVLTPMFTMVKAQGNDDVVTTTMRTRYPDGTDWYIITIVTVLDGKISRNVQYFAPVYEAPEWRAQWVQRTDGPD